MHQLLVVWLRTVQEHAAKRCPVPTVKEVAPLPRKDATWRWPNNRNRELALGLNRPAVAQVADTFPGAWGTVTDASLWSVWSTISLDAGRAPLPRLLPDLEGRLSGSCPARTDWMLAHLPGRDMGISLHLRPGQLP